MSSSKPIHLELELGGKTLSIETGDLAKQANGSVVLRYGETVVLVTACADRKPRPDINFLPLTVDYRENNFAAGKIPGGFFKREGRPTEKEILTCRQIDRPIRPLFPEGYGCETQVIANVISADADNNPDVIAITGAGFALYSSEIPFHYPVAAVRVGMIDGNLQVNPTYAEMEKSGLDITVVGTGVGIVMVEAGALELPESDILAAIEFGHTEVKRIVELQEELRKLLNPTKRETTPPAVNTALEDKVRDKVSDDLRRLFTISDKHERDNAVSDFIADLVENWSDVTDEERPQVKSLFGRIKEQTIRDWILNDRIRPDGRKFDEIRDITCQVGLLPRTHGSAVFTRGETQALVTTTLGTSSDAQRMESLAGESQRRFLLHYNFPPFSVGEVRFLRGPGRREIGHGALAARALESIIPAASDFPYTIRLVSDILESNGSSSMASVCGGTLSLMDAGVPIKTPIAGIAMGLVMEGDKFAILTDIAGFEDHYGDMDFKVAGSTEGITALQMDIKIEGVTMEILTQALEQARVARLSILDSMAKTIEKPREDIAKYAPRILTIQINKDKIRDIIGPGGKVIRSIVERTGAKIEVEDDGTVAIASVDDESAKMALDIINELVAEAEVGKTYLGKVQRLVEFMDRTPDAGIAGPRLLFHDGNVQLSCRRFYTFKVLLLRRTPLGKIFRNSRAVSEHLMSDFDHETTPDDLDSEIRQLLQERGWELAPGELLNRTRSAAWRKGGKGRRNRLQARILMVSYDRYRAHIYRQTETFDEYGQRILNQERQRELEWALAQRSDPGRAAAMERAARRQSKKDTSVERLWGCQ